MTELKSNQKGYMTPETEEKVKNCLMAALNLKDEGEIRRYIWMRYVTEKELH